MFTGILWRFRVTYFQWKTGHLFFCISFAYLHYILLSRMLLWQFYVPGNSKNYIGPLVNCPICLSDFNQIYIFSGDVYISLQYQISRKSFQWEGWLLRADVPTNRLTDMAAVVSAFRHSVNASEYSCCSHRHSLITTICGHAARKCSFCHIT